MKFPREAVDAYFQHGVDLENRRVFIGDIDAESVVTAVKALYLMETESKTDPCEMFISSYGGEVCEALALYDVIQTLQCPVHCFAYGKCMSAAPLLLAAGEPGHRWVAQHVSFMHHDWSAEVDGRGTQLQAYMKYYERENENWIRLLTKHSTKDYKFWSRKAKMTSDFFFGSKEALEWGIADAIWSEKD